MIHNIPRGGGGDKKNNCQCHGHDIPRPMGMRGKKNGCHGHNTYQIGVCGRGVKRTAVMGMIHSIPMCMCVCVCVCVGRGGGG